MKLTQQQLFAFQRFVELAEQAAESPNGSRRAVEGLERLKVMGDCTEWLEARAEIF